VDAGRELSKNAFRPEGPYSLMNRGVRGSGCLQTQARNG
jgi:hypothetical protein